MPNRSSKEFDFSKYPKRKVSIMFLYLGWEFDGLVTQVDTTNTVEEHIFTALLKTRLIEDRQTCGWTRCGRTDKGVSAFRQVASLTVRSTSDCSKSDAKSNSDLELPYTKMLNANLPKSIRILAYSTVSDSFHARHGCQQRVYTYFLPRAKVDIKRMNEASKILMGTHDFRNFCCIDKSSGRLEMSYVRTIDSAYVEEFGSSKDSESSSGNYGLLKLTVKATGFLWHQIRCIVTILYQIAIGNENNQLITELLDIRKNPARPHYNLANELPLCLFDCTYSADQFDWIFDIPTLTNVIASLQKLWAQYQTKSAIVKQMIDSMTDLTSSINNHDTDGLEEFVLATPNPKSKKYIPILQHPRCDSLELLREKQAKKRKHASKINDV